MDLFTLIMTIILYVLGALLLIGLIVLVIKLIITITKVNKVATEVEERVASLKNFFSIVDNVSDKLSFVGDKVVDKIAKFIINLFTKNKNDKGGKEDEEE